MRIKHLTTDELIELQGEALEVEDYELCEAIERELNNR